jgi:hypothetical protein
MKIIILDNSSFPPKKKKKKKYNKSILQPDNQKNYTTINHNTYINTHMTRTKKAKSRRKHMAHTGQSK